MNRSAQTLRIAASPTASSWRQMPVISIGTRIFVTDLAGSAYSADLDGKHPRNFLFAQGNLTGIAYAEV
jgi:hypothetical protein